MQESSKHTKRLTQKQAEWHPILPSLDIAEQAARGILKLSHDHMQDMPFRKRGHGHLLMAPDELRELAKYRKQIRTLG